MAKRQEIAHGTAFARLTYLRDSEPEKTGVRKAIFRCSCGTEKPIRISHVTGGKVLSCGCFISEQTTARFTRHGQSRRAALSKEWRAWREMTKRCRKHPDYAGRGITVCDRWLIFENFLADMGECPEGLSLLPNAGIMSPEIADGLLTGNRSTIAA